MGMECHGQGGGHQLGHVPGILSLHQSPLWLWHPVPMAAVLEGQPLAQAQAPLLPPICLLPGGGPVLPLLPPAWPPAEAVTGHLPSFAGLALVLPRQVVGLQRREGGGGAKAATWGL